MVDGAGARDSGISGRDVVRVPGAAFVAAHLPGVLALRLERERLLEQAAARLGIRVGANAVEALERELARDLRVVGDQRLVVGLHDGDLQAESFGILEAQAAVGALRGDVLVCEPLLPEGERLVGGDAEDDAMHHAGAGAAAAGLRILEEGQVAACAAFLVRVEEVVDGRVVLVHGLLDEPQAEDADVEVDVARRVGRDAGDVVDPLETHRRLGL